MQKSYEIIMKKRKLVIAKAAKPQLAGVIVKDFKINWKLYLLILPVLLFYLIFCYKPMYGALIAFVDYAPGKAIFDCNLVGLKYFKQFINSVFFFKVLKNTLTISVCSLVVGFPAPIILALLLNEVNSKAFSKTVQTISYLPHFISVVVICGMIKEFTAPNGIVTDLLFFLEAKDKHC